MEGSIRAGRCRARLEIDSTVIRTTCRLKSPAGFGKARRVGYMAAWTVAEISARREAKFIERGREIQEAHARERLRAQDLPLVDIVKTDVRGACFEMADTNRARAPRDIKLWFAKRIL